MFDQCKKCGNSLQYPLIIDEEVRCPRCDQIHVVMENGQLRRL
jgi:predicted Zn-ribbon and HTH transcriptional regulator